MHQLPRRGPAFLDVFIEVLVESSHEHVATALKEAEGIYKKNSTLDQNQTKKNNVNNITVTVILTLTQGVILLIHFRITAQKNHQQLQLLPASQDENLLVVLKKRYAEFQFHN